jgi:hypothetical protein
VKRQQRIRKQIKFSLSLKWERKGPKTFSRKSDKINTLKIILLMKKDLKIHKFLANAFQPRRFSYFVLKTQKVVLETSFS